MQIPTLYLEKNLDLFINYSKTMNKGGYLPTEIVCLREFDWQAAVTAHLVDTIFKSFGWQIINDCFFQK